MNCFPLNDRSLTDYRPRCMTNDTLNKQNNYDYRQYMISNAVNINKALKSDNGWNNHEYDNFIIERFNDKVVKAQNVEEIDNNVKDAEIRKSAERIENEEMVDGILANERLMGSLLGKLDSVQNEKKFLNEMIEKKEDVTEKLKQEIKNMENNVNSITKETINLQSEINVYKLVEEAKRKESLKEKEALLEKARSEKERNALNKKEEIDRLNAIAMQYEKEEQEALLKIKNANNEKEKLEAQKAFNLAGTNKMKNEIELMKQKSEV